MKSASVENLLDVFGVARKHCVTWLHNDAKVTIGHVSRVSECQSLTDLASRDGV
jgi:hypothetical protein